ncbi:MAG: DNA repair protein RadA [Candidatus Woesebacteria bacterium]|nr:DNA repair protein RadA [Candidatus Woesebacteria bacterium]
MSQSSIFVCQQCGNEFSKWLGKCTACNSWNSLVETAQFTRKSKSKNLNSKKTQNSNNQILKLTDIKASQIQRTSTGISELDRALGGGLVNGQVVLLAGEPGIGKSTILLQLADNIDRTLYVSGEESASQVAIRAKRLEINNKSIDFLESTDVDEIIEKLQGLPAQAGLTLQCVIVDSIQTMSTSDLTGLAGSVGQVKECAYRLLRYAKENNIPLILVGHVTKEGTVAGPAVLAHIVDTVLWFEGEKTSHLRLLRCVKNRFGATDEVGIFQMEDKGLIPLDNPEKLFLDRGKTAVAGSVVSILMEGTRSILVEIQSLVVPTKMAFPRRVAQGIDSKRLEMLLAVLFRRAGIPLYDSDVFVNVAGGIKANEPSVDLAICLSIASSFYEKALPKDFIAIGEVGLLGEVRDVSFQEKRIKDSRRLGFKNIASSGEFKYLPQVVHNYLK